MALGSSAVPVRLDREWASAPEVVRDLSASNLNLHRKGANSATGNWPLASALYFLKRFSKAWRASIGLAVTGVVVSFSRVTRIA